MYAWGIVFGAHCLVFAEIIITSPDFLLELIMEDFLLGFTRSNLVLVVISCKEAENDPIKSWVPSLSQSYTCIALKVKLLSNESNFLKYVLQIIDPKAVTVQVNFASMPPASVALTSKELQSVNIEANIIY